MRQDPLPHVTKPGAAEDAIRQDQRGAAGAGLEELDAALDEQDLWRARRGLGGPRPAVRVFVVLPVVAEIELLQDGWIVDRDLGTERRVGQNHVHSTEQVPGAEVLGPSHGVVQGVGLEQPT